ncbi:MAG TPA: hypothetical protein VMD92_09115 [Acidobacteriaceae bacterium]|jgi:hypothetical protein|nr:hypothetical protein [Acidobacteriaceae bacterium]
MRRALAIFLLAGFSFPLIAPLFTSGPSEASLPACCRRNGKHHCMMYAMMMGEAPSRNPTVEEKCPYAPFAGRSLMLPHAFTPRGVPAMAEQAVTSAAIVRDPEAGYRISADRTRQKRGPPSLS